MNRRTGGGVAHARGEVAEAAVRDALEQLRIRGLCAYSKTYPQTKVVYIRGSKNIVFTGIGAPDFVAGIKIDNKTFPMWLEIKTSSRKSTMTSKSVHQYFSLLQMAKVGGLAGYLVLWRRDKTTRSPLIDEWRIHPIETIILDDYRGVIKINRTDGIVVAKNEQTALFTDDDVDVWLRQPDMPDIMQAARAILETTT